MGTESRRAAGFGEPPHRLHRPEGREVERYEVDPGALP